MAKHAGTQKQRRGNGARAAWGALALAVVVLAAACAVVVVVRPPAVISTVEWLGVSVPDFGLVSSSGAASASSSSRDATANSFGAVGDVVPTEEEAAALEEQSRRAQATPFIASCSGINLRSAVVLADVTGIVFHQASFGYAIPLDTKLPEADYNTAADTRTIRVNREQRAGVDDWADAEVLHLWRTTDETAMDTSIDLGALAGTEVCAPVAGTVVLVRDYLLYNETPDVEIHIQPEGRPDLDCVLIHTTDPAVKAGDRVEAGKTPIAKVRDIESVLTDVQLGFFTPEGVGGNHTHIQVNDANYPNYRETRLAGAVAAQ